MTDDPTPSMLANRLGALATALADRQAQAAAQATGLAPGRVAAIISVGADPGIGATALAQVLGITQSVATRMADDLVREGVVEKRPGRTGRDLALHLTAAGEALRARLLEARARAAGLALSDLDPSARAQLAPVIDRLLTALTRDRRTADHICRFCDEVACGAEDCPVERAAQALSG
jgi:DNA-binding MarR family transcriptional regulator